MKRSPLHSRTILNLLMAIVLSFLQILSVPGLAGSEGSRRELQNLDPVFRESVLKGWKYFHTSFAEDGIACVNCHREHSDITSWAGSYPKVQFFDQTPYRVKTLRIVIIEALSRHTDLPPVESREMADDLQAYIAWWGDGQPLHPGISPEGRPPEEDLVELEIAITRGRSIFHRETPLSCIYCHSIDSKGDSNHPSIKDVFLWFPRYSFQEQRVVSFDTYLLEHCQKYNLVMSTEELVDIAAYLADLSSGNFLRPGSSLNVVENIR